MVHTHRYCFIWIQLRRVIVLSSFNKANSFSAVPSAVFRNRVKHPGSSRIQCSDMNSQTSELDCITPFSIMESTAKVDEEGAVFRTINQPIPLDHTCSTTTISTIQPQEDDFDDTAWSIYSNTFFLSGGIFYLIATSWDYSIFHAARDASIDDVFSLPQRVLYELLWFMGPFTYLLNSVIDVQWALKVRKRDVRRRELEKLLIGKNNQRKRRQTNLHQQDEVEEGGMEIIRLEQDAFGINSQENYYSLSIEQSTPKRKKRLRRILSPTKKILR